MFKNSLKGLFRRSLALGLLAMLSLVPVQAMDLKGLYQAEVPVKDQSRDSRFEVYPEALAQVVVKLTGDRSVPQRPVLRSFMANAVRMVQQFGYQELPDNMPILEEEFSHLLVVNFDQTAVSQALIEAGVPIWGRTRPEVLLWLAIEDRGSRYLLAADQSIEIQNQLDNAAHSRGLPMLLPLLDLDDQMQLNFADVWGDFRANVMQASERYGPDVILVGRMFRAFDGRWQARWSLYDGADPKSIPQRWQSEVNDQQAALFSGVDGAADRIAERYAQVYTADSAGTVALSVTAVNDLEGYARAMAYLDSLDIVSSVQPVRVLNDEVLFTLHIRSDLAGLSRAISLGDTLVEVSQMDEFGLAGQAFIYQLVP